MRWTIDPGSPDRLQDQVAACVRRGLLSGELAAGDALPPAAELADALSVNRNTVLAAYRDLRDDGVLEFRRGRGVRIAATTTQPSTSVVEAARSLIALANRQGLDRQDLIRLVKELP